MRARFQFIRCATFVLLSLGVAMPLCAQAGAAPTQRSGERASPVRADARATVPPLRRLVTLDFREARLEVVLDEIDRQAGIGFQYTPRTVPVDKRVSIRVTDATVSAALGQVLRGTGVEVVSTEAGEVMLVRRPSSRAGADTSNDAFVGSILGNVRDSVSEEPIAHVLVSIKGTELRSTTNDDGRYAIHGVPPGVHVIMARMLGYMPLEKEVTVADQAVRVHFALRHGLTRLQEVVTTATGTQRRLEIANSVTVIQADSVVQTQPIKDMTDLLETRVPGLVVFPSSGAPGAPSRIRVRGASSILASNDPIVVVDGMRVYADQSKERVRTRNGVLGATAPSVLDGIDPNSVETVEVLNGPSAATLYGADAANGVIVITTKHGRVGPARWDVAASHGVTYMPGRFPDAYFAFARSLNNDFANCRLGSWAPTCVVDSVVAYQVLNDPDLTVLGRGHHSSVSATVSGGAREIRYALTGSYSNEVGMLKLPEYEADKFRTAYGRAPEDWMERPQDLARWSLTSRIDFQPARRADLALMVGLTGSEQHSSSLDRQLSVLRGAYLDRAGALVYLRGVPGEAGPTLVPDFYNRQTNRTVDLRTGVNLSWQPFERFRVRTDAGLTANFRRDETLRPRGFSGHALSGGTAGRRDSLGFLSTGQGTATMSTLNVGATYSAPLGLGFRLDAAAGFNFTAESVADLMREVSDPAAVSITGGLSSQRSDYRSGYGWYVEPRVGNQRIFISAGLRLDGGSNYGGADASGRAAVANPLNALKQFVKFPKFGFSWLISDESFFPLKDPKILSLLRIRAAYGRAGVQPGPADALRLYGWELRSLDGRVVRSAPLSTFGNTLLRPERSTEIEGGLEAEVLDSRLSIAVTGYRKTKDDALLDVAVAPSVGGGGRTRVNIGVVRNAGFEITLGTNLTRADGAGWSTQLNLRRNRNVVVSLANDLELFGGVRLAAPGYPLFAYWERPIVGYADANGDGVVHSKEVLLGDSLAYLGSPEPEYSAGLHSTVALFRGALTLGVSFAYRDRFAQLNAAPGGPLARAQVDPSAPLADQALAQTQTNYGRVQTLSALRFNSLSVGWRLPSALTNRVGARSGFVHVQGTNLGLVTNYHGKDPILGAEIGNNLTVDRGTVPEPREWQVRLSFSY